MKEKIDMLNCKEELYAEINSLKQKLNTYINVFPSEIIKGLPHFEICDANYKNAFLNLCTQITSSLKVSDNIAAKVNTLLILADKQNDNDAVIFYGDILEAYENYKCSACKFIDTGYKILNKKDDITASALFGINHILSDAIITFKDHLDLLLK